MTETPTEIQARMHDLKARKRSYTLNQAAELLAGEPQWVRDGVVPGGRMSGSFMQVYSFLLSALASGELKARAPDNPDAQEVIADRDLCWDWVIEERHLLAFLEQRRACNPAFSLRLEAARNRLSAPLLPPRS